MDLLLLGIQSSLLTFMPAPLRGVQSLCEGTRFLHAVNKRRPVPLRQTRAHDTDRENGQTPGPGKRGPREGQRWFCKEGGQETGKESCEESRQEIMRRCG